MPSETELTSDTARELYRWDRREYFAADPKNYWAIFYRNRLEKILRAVSDYVPTGGSVLDIGCAQATAAILLAERGFKVTAIDANPESLEYARLRHQIGDITFLCMDAMELSQTEAFHAILLGEVLEHVPRPGTLVQRCRDMLRPGGAMICTTPNGLAPHNWLTPGYHPSMESPERAHLPSGIAGTRHEIHLFCFRPPQLRRLMLRNGLVVEKMELVSSYVVNPIGLHRFFPLRFAESANRLFSRIPVLSRFTCMTTFVIARKV